MPYTAQDARSIHPGTAVFLISPPYVRLSHLLAQALNTHIHTPTRQRVIVLLIQAHHALQPSFLDSDAIEVSFFGLVVEVHLDVIAVRGDDFHIVGDVTEVLVVAKFVAVLERVISKTSLK